MPASRPTPKTVQLEGLPTIHTCAAGMDIGAEEIVVAVPPDCDPEPVRVFRTFTPDRHALVAWFVACGIDTVAMDSTGVYWIPIYELLEAQGIVPFLVNARHVKTVPGRKSDWNDAQWLQNLHALGLLRASFRPDAEICALRTLVRYRAELIEHRSPHVRHRQKALKVMSRFPTVKQFCSWLGVVPRNDISGGKVLRSRTGRVVSRANQAFRMAAQAVSRTDTKFGAYFWSMRARKGPQQAIVATAHKLARTVSHLLKYGEAFEEERAEVYEEKRRQQEVHRLARRAEKLGVTLTQIAPSPAVAPDERPERAGFSVQGTCGSGGRYGRRR